MQTSISFLLVMVFTLTSIQAQNFNHEVSIEGKSSVLLGKINQEALSSHSYGVWFKENKEAFTPHIETVNQLKNELSSYTITAFMGTWCGDSKREVPKLYKVLEAAHFPMDRLTLVGVSSDRDTYKQSPGGEEEGLNIHRVPTFIVYKDGEEVNRIVESPVTSIESDLLQIIEGNYISNYHSVTMAAAAMDEMGASTFQKKINKIAKKLKPVAQGMSDLNTYSYTLFQAKKVEEAIAIATLNTLLFPEESRTFVRLANQLAHLNKTEKAKIAYEKALELDPENKLAKQGMAALNSK